MKRVIWLFVLLVFVTVSGCAMSTDKEIAFPYFPWGTSATEVDLYFNNQGGSWDANMPYEKDFLIKPIFRPHPGGTLFNAGYHGTKYFYNNDFKVGGYPVECVEYYCTYGITGGVLRKEKEASQLYAADYIFNPVSYEDAFLNLRLKLTDLYGVGQATEEVYETFVGGFGSIQTCNIKKMTTIWNGNNNTHVLIVGEWPENEAEISQVQSSAREMLNYLYITYYKGELDEHLNKISKLVEQAEKQEEAQNATGYEGL